MRASRYEDDAGFTALELVIVMLIMGLIMVPLVSSFVLGLTTTRQSLEESTNSADALLLGSFFDIDVSSAQTVGTTSSCGSSGTPVLQLRWVDDGGERVVAYRYAADADMQSQLQLDQPVYRLERVACGGSGATSVVARQLVAVPVVLCDGQPCAEGGKPSTVSINLSTYSDLIKPTGSAGPSWAPYEFGITASRKVTS